MIPILYDANETEFTSNGLGRLRDCLRCEVTEERNGIYECEFEYPVTGAHYSDITIGSIIAVEHDESGNVEPFDVCSYTRPINGVVTFRANHISYRLRKIVAVPTNISSITGALQAIKNTSIPNNPFSFDTDMFFASGYMSAANGKPQTVRELLGGIEGSVLDTYGGEYEFRRFLVYLWQTRGEVRDFTIRYGKNLIDYSEEVDDSDTYTAVVPFWAKDDVIVNGGITRSGAVPYNGRETCVPLDLSDKFETTPTAQQLQAMGSAYMQNNKTMLPTRSIKVDFIRLQDSEEYQQFANLQECRLCDSLKVIFPLYNMEGTFKIVKTVWDVLLERYTSMELGNLSITLSQALGITN